MRYVKFAIRVFIVLFVLAFLDYTLPSRDIVKVVGTEVVRTDVGNSLFWASSGQVVTTTTTTPTTPTPNNRDIRFINSIKSNGNARVYRNEDTGWGWPPYFKFSSGNLQAEAQQLVDQDQWVAVTHYGWRMTLISIYPNAMSIEAVAGPQITLIPWTRIIFAILLIILGIVLWRLWVHIREWFTDKFDRIKSKF